MDQASPASVVSDASTSARSGSIQLGKPMNGIKPTQPIPPKSTMIKTDKPRPHVCTTCTRSFARLEHLKRHERSHTKEKPFQCPVCERCFSRRDLLLRHKQKLHASFPESPKARSAAANNRRKSLPAVKKEDGRSSSVSSGSYTIPETVQGEQLPSNLLQFENDLEAIIRNAVVATQSSLEYSSFLKNKVQPRNRHRHSSFSASSATSYSKDKDAEAIQKYLYPMNGPSEVGFSTPQLLPASMDIDTPIDDLFDTSDPLFINPQQLLGEQKSQQQDSKRAASADAVVQSSGGSRENAAFNFQFRGSQQPYSQTHNADIPSNNFSRARQNSTALDSSLNLDDDVSPTSMMNFENSDFSWLPPTEQPNANQSYTPQSVLKSTGPFSPAPGYNSLDSPLSLNMSSAPPSANRNNSVFSNPVSHSATLPGHILSDVSSQHGDLSQDHFASLNHSDGADSNLMQMSNDHMGHISQFDQGPASEFNSEKVTGWRTMSNTEKPFVRQQGRKITESLRMHIIKLLSAPTAFSSNPAPQIPSVQELQKYIDSYNAHFGKHLPFLHESLEFSEETVALALGMSAVGALYCLDRANSFTIFEASRSCIHIYLESRQERRDSNGTFQSKKLSTPMWLVQALILGVIYGLFSAESLANEIAVAQANAVVSLAKSAGLHLSPGNFLQVPDANASSEVRWKYFIAVQERIRTMHVVHTICGLLTTAYNLTPSLESSELKCGSPCDESLWSAPSAADWCGILQKKGLDETSQSAIEGPNFGACLQKLIQGETLVGKIPQFTLLSLMYAIHLEINKRKVAHDRRFFEARRNSSVGVSPQLVGEASGETATTAMRRELSWLEQEKMNMESILGAWETTWSLSPLASLSPSSQYGPLMSDSIPLSSLAHVRLYLDLRRAKEFFWKRDFSRMGQELDCLLSPGFGDSGGPLSPMSSQISNGRGHCKFDVLLEAASYAADSISLWEKHSVKWTLEKTAIQTFFHTIISLFDCALVVSEYLNRLEKRGRALWSEEDMILAVRITKILARVVKVVGPEGLDLPSNGNEMNNLNQQGFLMSVELESYMPTKPNGPQLSVASLSIVSRMLTKVYVWPFAQVMAEALQTRGAQIRRSPADML